MWSLLKAYTINSIKFIVVFNDISVVWSLSQMYWSEKIKQKKKKKNACK